MRTKMPTGRYLHGAHGAPYFDKTLNLLALPSDPAPPSIDKTFFPVMLSCHGDHPHKHEQ